MIETEYEPLLFYLLIPKYMLHTHYMRMWRVFAGVECGVMKIFLKIVSLIILISSSLIIHQNLTYDNNTLTNEYISLSYSLYDNPDDEFDIGTQIYHYDIGTDEVKKVFRFEYTSQYPLGVYDKKENVVYYSKRVDDDVYKGDQIFKYYIDTDKEEQLTTNLFAVNYIIPFCNRVYFVGVEKNSSILKLGFIDQITKEIAYWQDDGDTTIETFVVNNVNNKIYISAYSNAEMDYNLQHQSEIPGQENFTMPRHTVYETDSNFSETRKLFSEEHMWIRMLLTNDTKILALCDRMYNKEELSKPIYMDTASNEFLDFEIPPYRIQRGDANFSADGKGIYTLSDVYSITNDGVENRGIYYYDLETKIYTPLLIQTDGFINNFTVIKY